MVKPPETERGFQAAVVELARTCGFLVYHTLTSVGSTPGFPDLVLCHPRRRVLIMVECKRQTGRLASAQAAWLDALGACGVDTWIWRPSDWQTITRILQGRPPREETDA